MKNQERITRLPTPEHLQPIAGLVNDVIANGTMHLSDSLKQNYIKNVSLKTLAPQAIKGLGQVQYDGVRVTAQTLVNNPLVDKIIKLGFNDQRAFLGAYAGSELAGIVERAETLTLLEQGGIAAVNTELTKRLQTVKHAAANPEEQREAIHALNRLLYDAVYFFPHLTGGIAVTFNESVFTQERADSHLQKFISRFDQEKFAKALTNTSILRYAQATNQWDIVVPLPYEPSSAYSQMQYWGWETGRSRTIEVATAKMRQKDNWHDVPIIRLELFENPYDSIMTGWNNYRTDINPDANAAVFTADEIKNIQFATLDRPLSPKLHLEEDRQFPLSNMHMFLQFRQFSQFPQQAIEALGPIVDRPIRATDVLCVAYPEYRMVKKGGLAFWNSEILESSKPIIILAGQTSDSLRLWEFPQQLYARTGPDMPDNLNPVHELQGEQALLYLASTSYARFDKKQG